MVIRERSLSTVMSYQNGTSRDHSPEAMGIAQGGMHQPDLRIGNAPTQPVHRLHLVLVQLIFACLDVDGNELVLISRRQVRANLALDERVASSGKFIFAVTAFGRGHTLLRSLS